MNVIDVKGIEPQVRRADDVSSENRKVTGSNTRTEVERVDNDTAILFRNGPDKNSEEISESTKQEELLEAVGSLNDAVHVVQRDIVFSVHEGTGKPVVQVLDSETQEVIRQLPPEGVLEVAEKLQELTGILFEGKA